MSAVRDTLGGLRRWYVFTDQGRKIVWTETASKARRRVEAKGLTVERVVPAPPPGEWPA